MSVVGLRNSQPFMEDSPGFWDAMKRYGGSALYSVGNLLDLPNSMIRDVAVGQNPFDQLLSPLSHQNRATGREVLNFYGLASPEIEGSSVLPFDDPGEWVQDLAGLAVEMFSPVGYLSAGKGAATRTGRLAMNALDTGRVDMPSIARRAMQRAGKETPDFIGPRQAMMNVTPEDIFRDVEGSRLFEQLAANNPTVFDQLVSPEHWQQPLSEGLGWNFWGSVSPLGSRAVSERGARAADVAGRAVQRSPLGRAFNAIFNDTRGGVRAGEQQINRGYRNIAPSTMGQAQGLALDVRSAMDEAANPMMRLLGKEVDRYQASLGESLRLGSSQFDVNEAVRSLNDSLPGLVVGQRPEGLVVNFVDESNQRIVQKILDDAELEKIEDHFTPEQLVEIQEMGKRQQMHAVIRDSIERAPQVGGLEPALREQFERRFGRPMTRQTTTLSENLPNQMFDVLTDGASAEAAAGLTTYASVLSRTLAGVTGRSVDDHFTGLMQRAAMTDEPIDVLAGFADEVATYWDEMPTTFREELARRYGIEDGPQLQMEWRDDVLDALSSSDMSHNVELAQAAQQVVPFTRGAVAQRMSTGPEMAMRLMGDTAGGAHRGADSPLFAGFSPRRDVPMTEQLDEFAADSADLVQKVIKTQEPVATAYEEMLAEGLRLGRDLRQLDEERIGFWHRISDAHGIDLDPVRRQYPTKTLDELHRGDATRYIVSGELERMMQDAEALGSPAAVLSKYGDMLDDRFQSTVWIDGKPTPKDFTHADLGTHATGKKAHAIALWETINSVPRGAAVDLDPMEALQRYMEDNAKVNAFVESAHQAFADPSNWHANWSRRQGEWADEIVAQKLDMDANPQYRKLIAKYPDAQYVQFKKNGRIVAEFPVAGGDTADMWEVLGPNNAARLMRQGSDVKRIVGGIDLDEIQGIPAEAVYRMNGMEPLAARAYLAQKVGNQEVRLNPEIVTDFMKYELAQKDATGWVKMVDDALAKIGQFYKANVTLWFPSFHFRNKLGGTLANMLSVGLKEAPEILWSQKRAADLGRRGPQTDAERQLLKWVLQYDVASREMGFMDVRAPHGMTRQLPTGVRDWLAKPGKVKDLYQKVRTEVAAEPSASKVWDDIRAGYRTGLGVAGDISHGIEWELRVGQFQHLIEKGYDPSTAARKVRQTHVDYGRSTPAEKWITRGIPFYKFTRGMAGWLADEAMERGFSGPMAKSIAAAGRSKDVDESVTTSNSVTLQLGQERWLRSLGVNIEPNTKIAGMGVPWEDVVGLVPLPRRESLRQSVVDLGSRVIPIARAPVEWATGYDLWSDRPREDMTPTLGRIYQNLTGNPASTVSPDLDALAMGTPAARFISMARQLTDDRPWFNKVVQTATGLAPRTESPAARMAEQRDILQKYMRSLGGRDFEAVNFSKQTKAAMTPAERARAELYENYVKSLQQHRKSQRTQNLSPF